MSDLIDLHVHTTASDGTFTSSEVISLAIDKGLKAIAITDHDTVSGVPSSAEDIELIPGIEFSTKFKTKVHILGYYIDLDNRDLKHELKGIVDDRDTRNEKIVNIMRSDGINVTYDSMKERFGEIVGRPHFAKILVENGIVSSINEAFDSYLNKNMRYWVRRTTLSLERCISLITGAGGMAVIAHPYEYAYEKNTLDELIQECVKYGARGIECSHSSHTVEQIAFLEKKCDEYGLCKTGGSDFHGSIKPTVELGTGKGQVHVPYSWLEKIKEELKCS